jgi:hypothetical protein
MGWANCGTDSTGRPIGYAHEGTCDHPGCTEKIDRGLDAACGGMHGEDVYCCEKYFCNAHLRNSVRFSSHSWAICDACAEALRGDPESWEYDAEKDEFKQR